MALNCSSWWSCLERYCSSSFPLSGCISSAYSFSVYGKIGRFKFMNKKKSGESISDLDASATLTSRIPSNFRKRNYQIAMALMEDGAKANFRTSKINCTKQEIKYKRFRVHCSKNKTKSWYVLLRSIVAMSWKPFPSYEESDVNLIRIRFPLLRQRSSLRREFQLPHRFQITASSLSSPDTGSRSSNES